MYIDGNQNIDMPFGNKCGKAGNKGLLGQTIIIIIIKVFFFLLHILKVLFDIGSTQIAPLARRIGILSKYK